MDSWQIDKNDSSAISIQQAASVFPGYGRELKITVTTGAAIGANVIDLITKIEGYRSARLAWGTANAQPLTIGLWVKSSAVGTIPIFAFNTDFSANSPSQIVIAAANTPQYVTATFPAMTTGAWNTGNLTGIQFNFRIAVSGWHDFTATTGNTFEMTGLVVLPGIEAPSAARSAFIMRPFDQELVTCQRYYEKSYEPQTVPGTASMNSGRTLMEISSMAVPVGPVTLAGTEKFRVIKRIAPTFKTYSPTSGAVGKALDGYNGVDVNCSGNPSMTGFSWHSTMFNNNNYAQISLQWTADARL
jgi:hypothetical protein